MGRKGRNFYPGGIYHVIQRGNNKSYIFDDQLDKAKFLDILSETMKKYPFHLLYYVLMDNHYHILLEMIDNDIGLIMKQINLAYSKYYNKKYSRSGTVYGERYSAFNVIDDRHFLQLLYYIANNPVKAGLVKHPSQYRFCAHLEIVSQKELLINKPRLFSYIDTSYEKALKAYMSFMESHFDKPLTAVSPLCIITNKRCEKLITLLKEVAGDEKTENEIITKSRNPEIFIVKQKFIQEAKHQGFTNTEIAKLLRLSRRSVNEY